ncbi:hypothetical protein HR10_01185 [Porphyromonas gulae]|nr:hypothetical protein HR10_01185 [Porphyromonas gulae]
MKNVAREFFRFGARTEKFTRRSEIFYARVFAKTRTAIRPFPAREKIIPILLGMTKGDEFLHPIPTDIFGTILLRNGFLLSLVERS